MKDGSQGRLDFGRGTSSTPPSPAAAEPPVRADRPARAPRLDRIPDVRDGLTRVERIILWQIHETQREFPGRGVPTATLYGRVVEHVDLSVHELQRILSRLTGSGL